MSVMYRASSLTIPSPANDCGPSPKSPGLQVARSSGKKCSLVVSREAFGSAEQVSEGTESHEILASVHFLGRQGSGLSQPESRRGGAKKTALLYDIQSNEDPSERSRSQDDDTDSSAVGLVPCGFGKHAPAPKVQAKSMNFASHLLHSLAPAIREGPNEELELSFIMDDPEEKPPKKSFALGIGTPTSGNSISRKGDQHLRELSPDNFSQSEGLGSCEQFDFDHDKELGKLANLHKSLMEKFERSSGMTPQRPTASETCIESKAELISRSVPFRNKFSELTLKSKQVSS
jgi:hypothetical protein